MTQANEKAADAWQGIDGNETRTNHYEGTAQLKTTTTLSETTVTRDTGFAVQPGTLLMQILCNGDNPASVNNRADYFITAVSA